MYDKDHAVEEYSRSGRTYVLNARTRLDEFCEIKLRLISADRWLFGLCHLYAF